MEASVSPENYWLMYVGLLAIHLFNVNFIFLTASHMPLTFQGKQTARLALPALSLAK
jgi:hypothetical protein